MTRWHKGIESINAVAGGSNSSIEDFFEMKNYEPITDEETQIFEEFSLITSTMAILIYVAKADKRINDQEKEQIINDIIFQMGERPYEFSKLSQKFGNNEREIILNIYNKILKDYQTSTLKLDKIIDDICVVYQNNPVKRYYLIRLSYYCALSDGDFNKAEKEAIKTIALKMKVPSEELKRIEEEVKQEVLGR